VTDQGRIVRPKGRLLTVIVPVYNEVELLPRALKRLSLVDGIEKQVVVVDDGSTDGTSGLFEEMLGTGLADDWLTHGKNIGKGAAIRSGLSVARGDVIAIQDGDLEYDPRHLPQLAEPILNGRADVVLGSRLLGTLKFKNEWDLDFKRLCWGMGAQVLSIAASMVTGRFFTDIETCQKVFSRGISKRLDLRENGFGVEPEMILKFSRMGARIEEMPVRYWSRTKEEGKKINFMHGIEALVCIGRYSFADIDRIEE